MSVAGRQHLVEQPLQLLLAEQHPVRVESRCERVSIIMTRTRPS